MQPDEIAGAQSHTYALTPPIVRGWFGGDDYIRHLVPPDFFFHISIATHPPAPRSEDRELDHPRATSLSRVAGDYARKAGPAPNRIGATGCCA